jgi:RNA polymerase sigma-70 factor (ECF subfamily)
VTSDASNIQPLGASEHHLLRRALTAQDRGAIGSLYARYFQRLRDYILHRIGSPSDAEDLTQDIFTSLSAGAGSSTGIVEASDYLFAAAKNKVRQHIRSQKHQRERYAANSEQRQSEGCCSIQPVEPDAESVRGEVQEAIEAALGRLPPKAREALRLRLIENIEPAEAARRAGCSLNALHQRLRYALRALRSLRVEVSQNGD